eukprot:CAMPEP_0170285930 /NCGR_PEP_ID=MMETSP0116_2-20130129/43019_1 /TAXON_ID=400756 /ORGANISM="Durinskia baltica, Strain CSIRO CS-38" /LENGTH=69 /DNA_ID=CAMNT_0010537341 /DNA_START=123 /DNA_END=329 /DNA_ORIENTATION=+
MPCRDALSPRAFGDPIPEVPRDNQRRGCRRPTDSAKGASAGGANAGKDDPARSYDAQALAPAAEDACLD